MELKVFSTEYFNVPVSICEFVLKNKKYKEFALYLYLKQISNGKIKRKSLPVKSICNILQIEVRHYRNCLNYLLRNNWVGYNEKTDVLFVRKWKVIKWQINGKSRLSARYYFNYRNSEKYFCFVAVVSSLISSNIRESKNKRDLRSKKAERLSGRSNQLSTVFDHAPFYSLQTNMITTQILAKNLGTSLSTISLLKKGAVNLKYLEVRKNTFPVDIDPKYFNEYKCANPEIKGLFKTRDGRILVKGCDSMFCNIVVLRRQ